MNNSIHVLKITKSVLLPNHPAILADIMISAWRSAFPGILSDAVIEQYTHKDECSSMFSQLLQSGHGDLYLASLGIQPMGLLYWLPETENDARIEAVLTIPDAWGKGVGAGLMEAALQDMASAGYKTVQVWPFSENLRAQRFYQKFGFFPSGRCRIGDAQETEYIRKL